MLDALLDKYADEGIDAIEDVTVLKVDPFARARHAHRDRPELRRQGPSTPKPSASSKPSSTRPPTDPEGPHRVSLSTTIKSIQDIMRKDVGVDGDAQRIGQLGWMLFLKIFDDRETGAAS